MDDSAVHIFWDHSNLFARMQDTCDDRDGHGLEIGHRLEARIKFPAMFDFAACSRKVEKAVALGSIPPDLEAIWSSLGKVGIVVDLQERGAESGKEIAVDEALENEMLKSIIDRESPAVAVILSGDGDFRPTADRFLDNGWGVEVLSFSRGFSPKLRQIARGSGGRGKYVKLDDWYFQLVYLQEIDGSIRRPTDELNTRGRPKV